MKSQDTFLSISLSSSWNEKFFRQICRENQNTFYPITFLEYRAVCEIKWKNLEDFGRKLMILWRMCIACR
jgi:hypothetical protein